MSRKRGIIGSAAMTALSIAALMSVLFMSAFFVTIGICAALAVMA